MKNDYLDFYGQHHISPVRQDISDMELHYERRKKLYRQCGIPIIAFKNAEILEVGPGGGYNTLAFFHWDAGHIDLVEANPKGIEDMKRLFAQQNILQKRYEIFPCRIEDYQDNKKYDVVIAEGFLHFLPNRQEIISKMKSLVSDNGIIVITCADSVSLFIENMKKLLGQILVKDILQYKDKVVFLSKLFRPQLARLRGASRPVEDWVQDMILAPALDNNIELSIGEAISLLGEDFEILGSSPHMFTDYSWYKDIWYDYREDYQRQFEEKHLSLLMANTPEQILPNEQMWQLVNHFGRIRELAAKYGQEPDGHIIEEILGHMDSMTEALSRCDEELLMVFSEIQDALLCILKTGTVNMEDYEHFFGAFGRGQQYIAFMKNGFQYRRRDHEGR